jgi:periplasmic protein TonB
MNKKIIKTTILIAFSLSTIAIKAQKPPPPPSICAMTMDKQDSITGIFYMVEKNPEFIGGTKAMFKFISDSIHYPNHYACYTVMSTVYIGFVVEIDGTLSDINIKRGWPCFNEEAIRLVKLMSGKWTCGYEGGKPVRVAYTIPIKFQLE